MERQHQLAVEILPPYTWMASELIADKETSGNDFVDILEPTLDAEAILARLKNVNLVKATAEDCDYKRKLSCQSLLDDFFMPVPEIATLQNQLDLSIKSRYRNTPVKNQIHAVQSSNLSKAIRGENGVVDCTTPIKMCRNIAALIGPKGSGKSAAVERCLSFHRQSIWHEKINQLQIVYLKVELKGITHPLEYCARVLEALEQAIGSEKYKHEVNVAPNVTAAYMKIRSLMSTYNVGYLVFDSLESTLNWKLNERQKLFSHLSGLAEITPVLLVSSAKLYEINDICLETFTWDPLKAFGNDTAEKDDRWNRFTKRLWKQNCLKQQSIELTDEMKNIWFVASKGVIGIAVRFFAKCQLEAIILGEECISPDLMRRVQSHYFSHHKSFLSGLKKPESDKPETKRRTRKALKRSKASNPEAEQREDFERVPKKDWDKLPKDDLRYLVSQQKDGNNYLALKNAGLVLPLGDFSLRDKFPNPL